MTRRHALTRWRAVPVALSAVILSGACRQDMHDAPRYEAYEKSEFFADKRSARPLVAGTVARGHVLQDTPVATGKVGGALVATSPVPVTLELVQRGRQRYDIYCAPCHGYTGSGDGIVVRRGFRPPASFHEGRVRAQPDGYIFDVITNGFGAMPDYAGVVPVMDRWAIVAYVRALQLSQGVTIADVPEDRRAALVSPPPAPPAGIVDPSTQGHQ